MRLQGSDHRVVGICFCPFYGAANEQAFKKDSAENNVLI
jgi:Zn-finger protein